MNKNSRNPNRQAEAVNHTLATLSMFLCRASIAVLIIQGSGSYAEAPVKLSGARSFVRFTPAEGVGINGSYRITITATIHNGALIADKNQSPVQVELETASGDVGSLDFSGRMTLADAHGKTHTLKLVPAWFTTIGTSSQRRLIRYTEQATAIRVGNRKNLSIEITIAPTLTTSNGVVSLGEAHWTIRLGRVQ